VTVSTTHTCPKQLLAGDSLDLLVAIPGDLTGWTGSARLTGGAGTTTSQLAGTVTTEGTDFRVKFVGSGGTSTLTAGAYQLTVWATSGSDRYTVAQFRLQVLADLSTGTPALAHAQQMLAAIETALRARMTGSSSGAIEEYQIAGRAVKYLATKELESLRGRYAAEVARLQNPDRPYGRVKAVFSAAGTMPDILRRYDG
jgi:hypothetical protein